MHPIRDRLPVIFLGLLCMISAVLGDQASTRVETATQPSAHMATTNESEIAGGNTQQRNSLIAIPGSEATPGITLETHHEPPTVLAPETRQANIGIRWYNLPRFGLATFCQAVQPQPVPPS